MYNKYIVTLEQIGLQICRIFKVFNQDTDLSSRNQVTTNGDKIQMLIDHYGPHSVTDSEVTKNELKTFNSVVAASLELKQLNVST